jgi:hypothetical protein
LNTLEKGKIRKMKKKMSALVAILCLTAMVNVTLADVTGDFKVASATYAAGSGDANGGDVVISGTVNHGAIQSGKKVVVDVNYTYSFQYQTTTTVNGFTTVTIPARCPNSNDNACRSNDGSANWRSKTEQIPYSTTSTATFNGASSMVAITAPTLNSAGRLNPKGKVTGYNWVNTTSVLATDDIVDPSLIPAGSTLVAGSVLITSVSWRVYLVDSANNEIADTVNEGSFTF